MTGVVLSETGEISRELKLYWVLYEALLLDPSNTKVLVVSQGKEKVMSGENVLDFDYDFTGMDRNKFLSEARETVGARLSPLGKRKGEEPPDLVAEAARGLLEQLNKEIAEFSAFPDVLELQERHFTDHGLTVPTRFKDQKKDSRFYWIRFPVTLASLQDQPFHKLECAIEFNPGVQEGHLRPRTQMILPDRKFRTLAESDTSLELRIGENFEFEVATGKVDLELADAKLKSGAGVDAKLAAKAGFVAGPFKHSVTKAELEHSPAGAEKVFWRMSAGFSQADDPTFIVVLKVPREVKEVKIAAALQAYHSINWWAADLSAVIGLLRERVATFFKNGAPIRDTQVWDITPVL